jgi:hypothetical protein
MFHAITINIMQNNFAKCGCVFSMYYDLTGVNLPVAFAAHGDGIHFMVFTAIFALKYPMDIQEGIVGLFTEIATAIRKLLDLFFCLALLHYQL